MEFIQSLKKTAQQIIELSERLAGRVHTWDEENSAPTGGYTDRAGFIVYDDVELFADVHAAEDGSEHLLRTRLAWSPKNEEMNLFTIITLDFYSSPEKTKAIIADSNNVTQRSLVELLQDVNTTPKLIHVSLESGKDEAGESVGVRYEYDTERLEKITEADCKEFLNTLNQAYEQIVAKI